MVDRRRFYLGRPGRVRALESITRASNPSATPELVGASTRSLSGRTTRDVFAVKRSWNLTWERMFEPGYQRLLGLLQANPAAGALRFVDLRNPNLLPAPVSLGGSDSYSTEAFEVWNSGVNAPGVLSFAVNTGWGVAFSQLDDVVDGNLVWVHLAKAGTPTLRHKKPVVVWPSSTYRFSFYLSGSSTAAPCVRSLDRFGAEISTVVGSNIAVGAQGQRYEYLYTPPSGTAEAQFGLQYTGTGALSFFTTAWYCGIDEPTLQPWRVGSGTPEVLTTLSVNYPWPGQYHCVLSVQEA